MFNYSKNGKEMLNSSFLYTVYLQHVSKIFRLKFIKTTNSYFFVDVSTVSIENETSTKK